ncbi:MAG: hypothetical protein ABIN58_05280 [candidate division WOR-3 bacterium]
MIVNLTGRRSGDNHRILYWTVRLLGEFETDDLEVAPFRDRNLTEMGVWIRSQTARADTVTRFLSRLTAVLKKQKIEFAVRRFVGADGGTGKRETRRDSSEKT